MAWCVHGVMVEVLRDAKGAVQVDKLLGEFEREELSWGLVRRSGARATLRRAQGRPHSKSTACRSRPGFTREVAATEHRAGVAAVDFVAAAELVKDRAVAAVGAALMVLGQEFLQEVERVWESAPDPDADRRGRTRRPGGQWARRSRRRSFLIRGRASGRGGELPRKAIRRR